MKIAVGVIILSIFVILVASPVSSNYFSDRVDVIDTTESSPSNPDSNDQESSTIPILIAIGFLGLVAVRRPISDQ